jgi:hypothetical protein
MRPDQPEFRSDLQKLEKERRPAGYRAGWQLEERLLGLGVMLLGVVGLFVVYGIYSGFLPAGLPPPPQPRGVLVPVPTVNGAACLLPVMAITSVVLLAVGFKRLVDP